ncbi:MAG TPA: hypothetical protein VFF06_23220 [Polyangia bacterium]|nr:hypothetical protein [Polyangia bacterium]
MVAKVHGIVDEMLASGVSEPRADLIATRVIDELRSSVAGVAAYRRKIEEEAWHYIAHRRLHWPAGRL